MEKSRFTAVLAQTYKGQHQEHPIPQTANDTFDAKHLLNEHLSGRFTMLVAIPL